MVALGAPHEQREDGGRMVPIIPSGVDLSSLEGRQQQVAKRSDAYQFALAHYNEAITQLSKRMDSNTSIEVALLACILFVGVEFLRGDSAPAVRHFKGGMNIAIASLTNNGSRTAVATAENIKQHILPFFNRIELLSNLFGDEPQWDYPVELPHAVPDDFTTMREARDSIVHLANLSVRFIKYMKWRKYERLVFPDDIARREALLRQLKVWASTLDKMLLTDKVTDRDLDAAKTLRIHQVIASIWLGRSLVPEECANDASIPEFETAVSLAEKINSIAGTREDRAAPNSSSFLFDMEVVSPLYFVATKCRHPQIRRRAIAVLKSTWRREGLWDSDMAAAMAELVMEIEEARLTTLDGSELPLEEDRIQNSQIDSDTGTNRKIHRVKFHTKPLGMDGPWKIWQEQIVLT